MDRNGNRILCARAEVPDVADQTTARGGTSQSRSMRTRLQSALPHLGSLAAVAIGYLFLGFPIVFLTNGPVLLGVILTVLWLLAPIPGDLVVLAVQERPSGLQSAAIRPYLRWFVVSLIAVAFVALATAGPVLFDNPVGDGLIWVLTGVLLMVPYAMPIALFVWSFARSSSTDSEANPTAR